MAREIAHGYISVSPNMSGFFKQINAEMNSSQMANAGAIGGKTIGGKFVSGVGGAAKKVAKVGLASLAAMGAGMSVKTFGGGMSRALALDSANLKIKALGLNVDKVKESALTAVKGTAFGLDAAFTAAGTLGASGIKEGTEMTKALQSAAGAAALSGISMEHMATMYGKASIAGKVHNDILNQLAENGVNATGALAKEMGVAESQIFELAKGGEISFETFSNAMYNAFGTAAYGANDTFQGALANVQAALSRLGAQFATPVVENGTLIFQSLITTVDNLATALVPASDAFGEIVKSFAGGLIGGLDSFNTYIAEGGSISGYFAQQVNDLASAFLNLAPIQFVSGYLERIINAAAGSTALQTLANSIMQAAQACAQFVLDGGAVGAILPKVEPQLAKVGDAFVGLVENIDPAVANLEPLAQKMKSVASASKNMVTNLNFGEISEQLKTSLTSTKDFFSTIGSFLTEGINISPSGAAFTAMATAFTAAAKPLAGIFPRAAQIASSAVNGVGKAWGWTSKILIGSGGIKIAADKLSELASAFKTVGDDAAQLGVKGSGAFGALSSKASAVAAKINALPFFSPSKLVGDAKAAGSLMAESFKGAFGKIAQAAGATPDMKAKILSKLPSLSNITQRMGTPRIIAAFSSIGAKISTALSPLTNLLKRGLEPLLAKLPQISIGFGGSMGAVGKFVSTLTKVFNPIGMIISSFITMMATNEQYRSAVLGLVQSIGSTLIPVFETLFVSLLQIGQTVLPVVLDVMDALTPVFAQVALVAIQLVAAIAPLAAQLINLVLPVVVQIIQSLAPFIQAVLPIVVTVINTILSIVTALMPVVQTVLSVVVNLVGGIIIPFLGMVITTVMNILTVVTSVIGAIVSIIGAFITTVLSVVAPIAETIFGFFNAVTSIATQVFSGVFTTVNTVFSGIANIVSGFYNTISGVFTHVQAIAGQVWSAIRSTISNVISGMISKFSSFGSRVAAIFGQVKNKIVGVFTSIYEKAKSVVSGITDFFGSIPGKISEMFSNIHVPTLHVEGGFNLDPTNFQIPHISFYGKGGIYRGAHIGVLGENGSPEANIPLDRGMRPFAAAIADNMGNSGTTYNIYVDGNKINDDEAIRANVVELITNAHRVAMVRS